MRIFTKCHGMQFALLTLFTLTIQHPALTQTDTTYIPFVAYWNKEDSYTFKVTKMKQLWQKKQLIQYDSIQYQAEFKVIDCTADGYTIRWSVNSNMLDVFQIPANLQDKLMQYNIREVIYATDKLGAFKEIENWQEISNNITKLITELIQETSKDTSVNREDMEKKMAPFISFYTSQRGIEQLLFKELQIIHFPFGKKYRRWEIYKYEEQLPNYLGGAPVKGDGILYFRRVDFDTKQCMLIQRMKIKEADAKKAIKEFAEKAGVIPAAIAQVVYESEFDIFDDNSFDYRYYPGIPVKITMSRKSTVNVLDEKSKRIDTTLIELVE